MQGGSTKAEASDKSENLNRSNFAIVTLNSDGSINIYVKSFDYGQEVVIVGWKEQYLDKVYDLGKDPFPVQNK